METILSSAPLSDLCTRGSPLVTQQVEHRATVHLPHLVVIEDRCLHLRNLLVGTGGSEKVSGLD